MTDETTGGGSRPEPPAGSSGGGAAGPEALEPAGAFAARARHVAGLGTFILLLGFALHAASGVLLPIVLAVFLKFLLSPFVRFLGRLRVPTAAGGALVLAVLVAVLGVGAWRLAAPATGWLERAPATLAGVERALRDLKRPVEQIGEATNRVGEMTQVEDSSNDGRTVTVAKAPLSEVLFSMTTRLAGSLVVILILLFFLLTSGDSFLRKLVEAVPRLTAKKEAVRAVRDIERDLSRYLLTVTAINVSLGGAVALAMHLLGLPNPLLWGAMATLLNYVPYLGAVVGAVVVTLVAAATFPEDPGRVLWAPVAFLALSGLEGSVVTPIILGTRLTLHPVAIFVGVLFWGWFWGVPGALLAVPLLVTLKIVLTHVDGLQRFVPFLER